MSIFNNKEIRNKLIISLMVTVILSALGFSISFGAGMLIILLGVCLYTIQLIEDKKRYAKLARLNESIDVILHSEKVMSLDEFSEGELSILASEINKLAVRLTEKNQKLMEDKIRLSDAIADISHQLKTPLTSMEITYSMLLAENISLQKRIELVRELKKNSERFSNLVSVLLKISKLDAGTAVFVNEEYSAKELIKAATENLMIPLDVRDIKLAINCNDEHFSGDILWQAEAIGNIVKNCMEHTPEGGSITIDVSETPIFLKIEINDNGTGISKEDLPHIFERFYKGSNSDMNSYGIGLSLARTIIMAQNGTVLAGNNSVGGAKFVVTYYKQVV